MNLHALLTKLRLAAIAESRPWKRRRAIPGGRREVNRILAEAPEKALKHEVHMLRTTGFKSRSEEDDFVDQLAKKYLPE